MSIGGFRKRDGSRIQNIATGTFGPKNGRREQTKEWFFPVYRSRLGVTTVLRDNGIFTAFTIFSPISIRQIPKCKPRSSKLWGFGFSSAFLVFAWMRCLL